MRFGSLTSSIPSMASPRTRWAEASSMRRLIQTNRRSGWESFSRTLARSRRSATALGPAATWRARGVSNAEGSATTEPTSWVPASGSPRRSTIIPRRGAHSSSLRVWSRCSLARRDRSRSCTLAARRSTTPNSASRAAPTRKARRRLHLPSRCGAQERLTTGSPRCGQDRRPDGPPDQDDDAVDRGRRHVQAGARELLDPLRALQLGGRDLEPFVLPRELAVLGGEPRERVSAFRHARADPRVQQHGNGDQEARERDRREVVQGPALDAPPDGAAPMPHESRSTARNRALRARGLAEISSSAAPTGFFVRTFHCALRPQAQTGSLGGQMQPVASLAKPCFTIRSSSE